MVSTRKREAENEVERKLIKKKVKETENVTKDGSKRAKGARSAKKMAKKNDVELTDVTNKNPEHKHREDVEESELKEDVITFDKEKEVEKLKKILELPSEAEKIIPEHEKDDGKKNGTTNNSESNLKRLYLQLKELRTTEVEQLLKDVRATATAKEQAQQELIEELTAEVARLKEAQEEKTETIEWKKEYIELKAAYEQVQLELKDVKGKLVNPHMEVPEQTQNRYEQMEKICKFYKEFTALRVELTGSSAICIAANKKHRKLVKFEIRFCEDSDEDGASCFEFIPMANKSFLPHDLQEKAIFKHFDAQKVLSRIWSCLEKS